MVSTLLVRAISENAVFKLFFMVPFERKFARKTVDEVLEDILAGCEVVTFVKLSHFQKTRTTVILLFQLLGY